MNKKHDGAATFVMSIIIVMLTVLLMIFAGNFGSLTSKSTANVLRNDQAFNAAQAGLDYGIAFVQGNYGTVTANPVSGYINYSIARVTLANNASFVVSITNPTASNYSLLTITSTGTGNDATSTRVIMQQTYLQSNNITFTAVSGGNVTFVGGSKLTNTLTNLNLQTGGTFTINNGAATYTSSGQSSTQGNIKSDVKQNVAALQGMTEPQFFQTVVGASEASVQAQAQASGTNYNNAVAGGDYSQTLKGKSGVTIFITQSSVSLGQGVTIGTAANPVTIIVEGDLTIANGVTIYGYVYSSAPSAGFNLAGGAAMTGGIASYGVMNISNGFQLTYSNISKIAGGASTLGKISGSWKDF